MDELYFDVTVESGSGKKEEANLTEGEEEGEVAMDAKVPLQDSGVRCCRF